MPTENMQVAASSDDAEQGNATVLLTGGYIRMDQGSISYGGFRFVPDSSIPQGATIISATFSYKYTTTSYDTLTATVWAEDGAGPVTFTTDDNDVSSRTPTTATTNIADVDVGVDWRTLDVATIIQELATDYTITAIVIVVNDTAGVGPGRIVAWDSDVDNCTKLDVEYSSAPAVTGPFPTFFRV